MGKLSEAQYGANNENRRRAARGKFRRVPIGRIAPGNRTLFGLEKRGLVAKAAGVPDVPAGNYLWTLTTEGRAAFDAHIR